jgi:hypothetical protein
MDLQAILQLVVSQIRSRSFRNVQVKPAGQGCLNGRPMVKITVSSGRRPDVRPRLSLLLERGFTHERVFTVRRRGKNRVRVNAAVSRRGRVNASARARVPAGAGPSRPAPRGRGTDMLTRPRELVTARPRRRT